MYPFTVLLLSDARASEYIGTPNYHYLALCVQYSVCVYIVYRWWKLENDREGCMGVLLCVCVQQWSQFPLCTQQYNSEST